MSIRLDSPTQHQSPKITIENDYLKSLQQRYAFATILIPFFGFVIAIYTTFKFGISSVEIGLFLVMYTLTMLGITVGFHRHFAHCAFRTNTVIRVLLAILGSMSAQGPVIQWASIHRRHHKYSDRPGDPHSPLIYQGEKWGTLRGLWHGQIAWMLNSDVTNTAVFAKDLLKDPVITKVNRLYLTWVVLGLAIPAILNGLLTETWTGVLQGFIWSGLVRMFCVNHAFWTINSIAHCYGQRPFDTEEQSHNTFWLSLANFGEAWHNNHHAFPNSALLGLKWWQIDIGGWVILALKKVGLAWDIKTPTAGMITEKLNVHKQPEYSELDVNNF
ncbi:acyl-CoA desaturase [Dolichospermum sp. LEGE 00240]|uniref:acyl-CoA desaturase n=1 Tax=Dolichospermum sp. LEGE 00240 TaxID=1828603 RepID=UPI00187FAA6D|nr:acyl-CoA desaturase [Dolichospermum sp. LEGE 00240]MBE9252106.1 acyl-CoA desaturase [Dolichospermum sp. LEGE 00240]